MRTRKYWAAAAAAAMVALSGTAQAALVLQSNGVEVLDTDTNLLWLHDWSSSNLNSWYDASRWAGNLTTGGVAAGAWRLAEIDEYQDLWAKAGSLLAGLQNNFKNVESTTYWSGTVYAPDAEQMWGFYAGTGVRSFGYGADGFLYAVAVRSGDVITSVPEPQTLALALLALGATVVARRRRSR